MALSDSLLDQVRNCGVVGSGGAGFPTHVKLAAQVDTLVINAAECEPVLVTDQWLTISAAADVVDGIRAVARQVGAGRIVIGIKEHYHAMIAALRPHLAGAPAIEFHFFQDFYPAGDEHVMVHDITGRIVPEGGIPLDVGVVVQNVSTMHAVRRAMFDQPFIRKAVTVAGEVARPGVYEAPIGMSAAEVINAAGGSTLDRFEVIDGGPMMGGLQKSIEDPVIKTTAGYIVLPPDHHVVRARKVPDRTALRRTSAVCCQCRMCTDMCPRFLLGHRIEPHQAMRGILAGREVSKDVMAMAWLCSQCGVCEEYACDMGLSPKHIFKLMKERLVAEGKKNPCHERPETAMEQNGWIRVPKARLTRRLGLASYLLPHSGEIRVLRDPWLVRIPLKQHAGAPSIPVVTVGDAVRAGQLIGEIPEGRLGARIHASISGVVRDVAGGVVTIERS
ncbi:MAG TPA: SLBB domain-containing protein [Myxococcota bacterium]|nr:SLBB domain-containing protein [Myxococcota bacterium]HPV04198.1 SLBB domain-containing protein [Myxococcota bacterium]